MGGGASSMLGNVGGAMSSAGSASSGGTAVSPLSFMPSDPAMTIPNEPQQFGGGQIQPNPQYEQFLQMILASGGNMGQMGGGY